MKKVFVAILLLLGVLILVGWYLLQSDKLKAPSQGQDLSVAILNKLNRNYSSLGPVEQTGDQVTVRVNNWQVIFSKKKDLDTQIRALQEIVNNLRIDQDKKVTIDLRFNKAVIRGAENSDK